MKKYKKETREFEKIKSQLSQIRHVVRHSKDYHLWHQEASVRKKIKSLKELRDKQSKDFMAVYSGYLDLLDEISVRLLNYYNKKNGTDYQFSEIIEKNKRGYISSGIISVLTTSHIPMLIQEQFKEYFPANPKDEYEKARSLKRKIVLHLGETNTGKTYQAIERLKQAERGVYLAPLRLLALENFEKLNNENVPCHLITGEEEILVENAKHISSTVEILDINKEYDIAVIDEIQMIANSQRGDAWTRALLGLRCGEIHLCGAINAKDLIIRILEDLGDLYEIIEYKRDTPLVVYPDRFTLKDAEKGDALVAFSKKRVLELSKYFLENGIRSSVIYGDLPPEVRKMQYQAFIQGDNRILITTDAIGMGVNLPIRRIIFMNLQKFDGEEIRYITSQEVKQIGGRAGRKGIYDVGYVGVSSNDQDFLKDHLELADEPLYQAVLGPSEAIIDIKGLPLKEKLALWSTSEEELNYYRKMDIRDYLLVLENIRNYRLAETIEYKLMKLPFDVNDLQMMQCFINFVEEHFARHKKQLLKPQAASTSLFDSERYYQKLNLYYSFSKNFYLDFDPEWVYQERERTSVKINKLLLKL